jgi:excisionase family DNA binding protein
MTMDEHIGAIVEAAVRRALEDLEPHPAVDPLWDTEKVATYLGVTERTIANLRAKGMPFRRIGDVVRFDKAEIDAWTRAQAKGAS